MRRRRASYGFSMMALAAVSACVDEKTTPSGGGDRFDAAAPPSAAPVVRATDAGDGAAARPTGSSFEELFRDYFGATGQATCAGDGACHGAADQPGAIASGGYICPPTSRDECYAGITNKQTQLVIPGDTTTPVASRYLHVILRKSDGTGIMPKRPPFVFDELDMARIDAWLLRGAPNDDAKSAAATDAGGD
ncbi:MAG: hypothetical protein IPG50_25450 [Myxococcales bacterium]|nr:hypothetical protein [Myxococcales bacterium]